MDFVSHTVYVHEFKSLQIIVYKNMKTSVSHIYKRSNDLYLSLLLVI